MTWCGFSFFMFLILGICRISPNLLLGNINETWKHFTIISSVIFVFSPLVSEHLSACILIHFQFPHRPLMLYSFLLSSLFCLSCYVMSFAMLSRLQMFSPVMPKPKLIQFNEFFISSIEFSALKFQLLSSSCLCFYIPSEHTDYNLINF